MYLYTLVIDADQGVNLRNLIDVCAIDAHVNAHN